MYTLSFLVIYPSNCHFYKCQPNTQLFQKTLFNSFYQILSFLKMHFFIMHFLKTQLFHYALLQKAKPNSEPATRNISPSTVHVIQSRALISRILSPLLPHLPSHIIHGKIRKFWTDNQPKVQTPIYPPRLLHFEV